MPDQAETSVKNSKKVFIVILFMLRPYDYACTYAFVACVRQPENDTKLTGRVFFKSP